MRLADGSFSARAAQIATDPRRAMRLAERIADGEPLNAAAVPPGTITQDAASVNQLLASGVNFDRAGFAYDVTQYGPYTVNGIGGTFTWTKVGGNNSNNLRLPLGGLDAPVYVWIWATFGWALDAGATTDHGQFTAVVYDSLAPTDPALACVGNITSDICPNDGLFHEKTYLGFFALDPLDPVLTSTNPSYTSNGDWNIGLQHRYNGGQKVTRTTINRQSIIAFISSFPPDGAVNYTLDATLT